MRSSRRLALADLSDDEEEQPRKTRRSPPSYDDDQRRSRSQRKRKNVKLYDYEDEEEEIVEESKRSTKSKQEQQASGSDDGDDGGGEDEDDAPDAKPIGDYVRVSGKGRKQRHHYEAFEYDGTRYELEDSVLLVPEEKGQKPYVAIIKDITQSSDGNMMVLGQWFYRPEEAEKKGGGNWKSSDTRELFYSFHRDEVPAESVMHKCVVHFIPLNKQIPKRKQHPGFIVQRVYDTVERRLFKLTDKDYEDNKQHEIDLLVQKTFSRVGDIPDIETEGDEAGQEDQMRNKRLMKRKMMSPLDVSRVDEETSKSGQFLKAETPGSCNSIASEYHTILGNFKVLTGDTQRDRWLERLLQGVRYICGSSDKQEASQNGRTAFPWPVAAVPCIVALEKESHESFSSDFQKYNKKMRQLQFNLKSNAQLARRLLNGELEPAKILNMSHIELKEGLTAEEIASNKPEESVEMQMTDARCDRCGEKKVGISEIIQAGHGDRYQLQCNCCGNSWWASRDETSTLTIDGPSSARSVGTAPLATAKFEDVEKLASPRESASEVIKKTTEAYMPVLDNQRSFNKSTAEDNAAE